MLEVGAENAERRLQAGEGFPHHHFGMILAVGVVRIDVEQINQKIGRKLKYVLDQKNRN